MKQREEEEKIQRQKSAASMAEKSYCLELKFTRRNNNNNKIHRKNIIFNAKLKNKWSNRAHFWPFPLVSVTVAGILLVCLTASSYRANFCLSFVPFSIPLTDAIVSKIWNHISSSFFVWPFSNEMFVSFLLFLESRLHKLWLQQCMRWASFFYWIT